MKKKLDLSNKTMEELFDTFADKSYEEFDGHRQVFRHFPSMSKEKFIEVIKAYYGT